MPIIYRKTARGLAEVETRVYKLSPRLRSVLIMIDGKRSDAEIVQLIPQAAEALAALVQDDFIAEFTRVPAAAALAGAPPSPATSPATSPGGPPGGPAPTVAPALAAPERTIIRAHQPTFEAMRRDLLMAFNERLGPSGEGMSVRLAQARNETEFRALLPAAVQLVATLHGRDAAEAFLARINAW